jgi:diaminohydroxyphosphoribosylaminopyrimidine deaminase/5-amino-6-(5-phosphoribosylamino)uracil reductase
LLPKSTDLKLSTDKYKIMKRVFQLATHGTGLTSPNPLVGCVIIKNNKIIGEGFHKKYGGKHAETAAIDNAKLSLEGATLYTNLEPCCPDIPDKKTPPCTDRIIKEKIRKVVICTIDPNPYVNGKGVEILKKSGINVEIGLLADEAKRLNEKYFKYIQTGIPFVHLKIAQSIDGRIATSKGKSQWITNQAALKQVHELRAAYDSVLVGVKTVIMDDPLLTVRLVPGKNPKRIILDNNLNTPPNAKILSNSGNKKNIIFTGTKIANGRIENFQRKNIEIFEVNSNGRGNLDLKEVLSTLGKLKISSVLVEGGGKIFTSFVKEKLFDKISFFIAPLLIGDGIQSIGPLGINTLAEALKLERVSIKIIDQQALVEGYRDYDSLFNFAGRY